MKTISTLRAAALAATILVSALGAGTAHALPAADAVGDAGAKAAAWLATKQEPDGGFGSGFSPGSDIGATADAVLALAAADEDPAAVKSARGRSPLDFFSQQLRLRKAIAPGQYAKMALAVRAAGLDPRAFNRADLLKPIESAYDAQTGVIGDSVFVHCLGMLALARSDADVPAKAATTLESLQANSGGWAFTGQGAADVDTTALCAQALIAAGRSPKAGSVGDALRYLRSVQNADGGFPYQSPSDFGTDTNANSTALVAQTIVASGDQPESWGAAKGNPLSALITLQRPSGAIAFQAATADENILATAGAVPALARQAFGE